LFPRAGRQTCLRWLDAGFSQGLPDPGTCDREPNARKVMESYQSWLGEGPEVSVLRMLGLFI
jgi:hypothetical protein